MRQGKILVVDDDIHVVQILDYKLKKAGYQVRGATSGRQALEICRQELPDIILLDIMMPEMNGWEVLSSLKADKATKDIPVFMLTAKAQRADLTKALSLGVDNYIIKPFAPQRVLELVDQCLGFTASPSEAPKNP